MAVIRRENGDLDRSNDEIEMYQLGRYICTNEAFWRIFDFSIHGKFPAVTHLHVHLENHQRVYFAPGNAHNVANNLRPTTLTAFFDLCQRDPWARTLLYSDIPAYYTWDNSAKIWNRRSRGITWCNDVPTGRDAAIGRLYAVHPNHRECFYLRLLLISVRGPTSFRDLKYFEGVEYRTFEEVCRARGLLESDAQWEHTLREAAATRNPSAIRNLFAVILTSCAPISDPMRLWELFREDMSEDILRQRRLANPGLELDFDDEIFNEALILIEDTCLRMSGQRLVELGLPEPNRRGHDATNSDILRETSYNAENMNRIVSANLPLLVADQKAAFQTIIEAIRTEQGGIFFLDAPGGTGKTFLINLILAYVRQRKRIIVAAASSGIAATLLEGGRTAHTAFKLPFDVNRSENPICGLTRGSSRGQMFQRCSAIIWDECTMAHKESLQALDLALRDLRRNDSIMGGIVVVLAGDFRQTLPVIPRGTAADELDACLKQSHLWPSVTKLHLSTNMRVLRHGDCDGARCFARNLLRIGDGTYPVDSRTGLITLSSEICCVVANVDELIQRVFPNLQSNIDNKDWLFERAILAPTNDAVRELNFAIQEKLTNRQPRTYSSVDSVVVDQAVNYPVEFLNSISPPGFPPHQLTLKVGSPIMLLRNMDPPKLCNGTRMSVKSMHNNLIVATILSGPHKDVDVFIPRIPLKSSDDLLFEFKRLQFPIQLAYSFTVNKSQGQTLRVAGINLTSPCFSHGQLYVACSRVGKPSNIFILAPENKTKNVVYQQALV